MCFVCPPRIEAVGKTEHTISTRKHAILAPCWDNTLERKKVRRMTDKELQMHNDFLEWYYETHSRRKKTEEKANQDP